MGHPLPDVPQKENPPGVLAGEVSGGIEDLSKRIQRYQAAKLGSLDVAQYIESLPAHQRLADRVRNCGDYLVFRHYFTVDQVKLHGARLCQRHLLCPLCAIRRGAKSLKAYLDRWELIHLDRPALRPFLITLTVRDGADLAERFDHLHRSQHELWKRKLRGRGCALDGVAGAVWSYEIKRGSGSGLWHPHLHAIALAETAPGQAALSAEWLDITGDSHVVDVRPISECDTVGGFAEVFKYAVKFSEQPASDTFHAWETLRGKRLLASSGCFRGVPEVDGLLDDAEALEGLPFVTLFYRFLLGTYRL